MPETAPFEVKYLGRRAAYELPLGIYLDGQVTGRIHDAIIPKYHELDADRLAALDEAGIRIVRDDATRQLAGIAQQDSEEVRRALTNTINLTKLLLKQ
ncbi:MAG TPA: hypothetical protein VJK51_05865 [Candidatus Nanoarchaeia archaeon]|nr:hypothetical protein [Candidatus Nanoarchaeia archaeon]